MNRNVIAGALVTGVLLTGTACGTGGVASVREGAAGRPNGTAAEPAPHHKIDWGRPLVNGVGSSRAHAKTQGGLAFDPIVPQWSVRESAVQVSPVTEERSHRSVAFVYDFPTGPDFPTTGRIVVVERPVGVGEPSVEEFARSHGTDHYRVIDLNGRKALLVQARGIGRVRLIRDGIVIDVTGPEAPPASVVKLAAALA